MSHIPSISRSWWIHLHSRPERPTSPHLWPHHSDPRHQQLISIIAVLQLMLSAFSLPCLLTLFTHIATRVILWKYKWDCYFSVTTCSKSSLRVTSWHPQRDQRDLTVCFPSDLISSSLLLPPSASATWVSLLSTSTLNTSPSQDLCVGCYIWLMLSPLMGMAHSLAAFNFCLCPSLSEYASIIAVPATCPLPDPPCPLFSLRHWASWASLYLCFLFAPCLVRIWPDHCPSPAPRTVPDTSEELRSLNLMN